MINSSNSHQPLFWGCFIALIATAFGFIIRAMIIDDWAMDFQLSETEKGTLLGVGLWPFAISIVVFSLIIDRIGYRNAMIFGLACHVVSAVITISAKSYEMLYLGTFIVALGNGTVEAYINPVVSTLFHQDKTKWLNRLHAGWPGGFVLGGILIMAMGANVSWQVKVGLILIPTIAYGILLWNKKFPISERVAAGVSYIEMLKEVGILGALIINALVFIEIGKAFDMHIGIVIGLIVAATGAFGYYTRSLGQPLFVFLLFVMMLLATTELGVDSWITELMGPEFVELGIDAGWILVYTAAIMMVLRFFAGPIVHRLSPLGLLAVCSLIAAIGLFYLSTATGIAILLAATLYAIGKSFFWPTMLGVVAERFPKGGALTLNAVGGVGMLAVGIVGASLLGFFQDKNIDQNVLLYDQANNTTIHQSYMTSPKSSFFGDYMTFDQTALTQATPEEKTIIQGIQDQSKKDTLSTAAILPVIMLVCFVALVLYFRSKGGYEAVKI